MSDFKYKMLGEWRGPVSAERILQLITNGTLNPYDLIMKEGQEDKKSIICKHDDFKKDIGREWAKLRSVRAKLDQLWKAQRDSLLAAITGTNPEKTLEIIRGDKIEFLPIHKKADEKQQVHRFVEDIEKSCLSYWRKADKDLLSQYYTDEPKKIFQKEIKKWVKEECLKKPDKYSIDQLSECSNSGEKEYKLKKNKVLGWLAKSQLCRKWGIYIFYDINDQPLYVGETATRQTTGGGWTNGNFEDRAKDHFNKAKKWALRCTKIRILLLNTWNNSFKDVSQAMERLLILKYDLDKLKNKNPGTKQSSVDDILSKLESEITGLCEDGELADLKKNLKKKLSDQKKKT